MDNNQNNQRDNRFDQIINYLASAASVAADGVSDAVQSAGNAVEGKYTAVKLNLELTRLHDEQAKLFADIGRTMFLIKNGAFKDGMKDDAGNLVDAQETVDRLLQLAADKQAEIDAASAKLSDLNGGKVCVVCGKVGDVKDTYCSACGAKLPEKPPAGKDGDAGKAGGADDDKDAGKADEDAKD